MSLANFESLFDRIVPAFLLALGMGVAAAMVGAF